MNSLSIEQLRAIAANMHPRNSLKVRTIRLAENMLGGSRERDYSHEPSVDWPPSLPPGPDMPMMSYEEVGRALHLSADRVKAEETRAFRKIRRALIKMESVPRKFQRENLHGYMRRWKSLIDAWLP